MKFWFKGNNFDICEPFCDASGNYLARAECDLLAPFCCGDCFDRYCCEKNSSRFNQLICNNTLISRIKETSTSRPLIIPTKLAINGTNSSTWCIFNCFNTNMSKILYFKKSCLENKYFF